MITRKAAPGLAAGCTGRGQAGEPDALLRAGAGRARRAGRHAGGRAATSSPAASAKIGRELTSNPIVRKLTFTGIDRGRRQAAWPQCAPTHQEDVAWSSAATRRSSCSTTPTSTPPSRARWPASSATPARPASAPTASTVQAGVYDAFAEKLAAAVETLKVGNGIEEGVTHRAADQRRRRSTRSRSTSPTPSARAPR